MPESPVYLDCNATTPVEPRVIDLMTRLMSQSPSNAGSRTHAFGLDAARIVERAREHVASVVAAEPHEVVFTSGATESNNLAILGLAAFGARSGRKHVVCSAIEHKAVLEPVECLRQRGFDVSILPVARGGTISVAELEAVIRKDTLLVSIMHVNNETGVIQPLQGVAEVLQNHSAYLHVDAAQGFGKELALLRLPRIDLISMSGHKIYGPQGVGALVARRRASERPPIVAQAFGGGQERGLRPGTLPVYLILGLGEAARLAVAENTERRLACERFRQGLLEGLAPLSPQLHGESAKTLSSVVSLSFGSLDSEAIMLAIKRFAAISNGSACTSASYSPSHVLTAMGLSGDQVASATRWSWCHMTPPPDWEQIVSAIRALM